MKKMYLDTLLEQVHEAQQIHTSQIARKHYFQIVFNNSVYS